MMDRHFRQVDAKEATIALGVKRVPLTFIGASRSLREQALPMLFRTKRSAVMYAFAGIQ